MLRKFLAPVLAATLVLAACKDSPTSTTSAVNAVDEDYALVMFGEAGSALEGMMGTQPLNGQPFDGRSYRRPFPDSIALSQVQIDSIEALRQDFRDAHQAELDSLRTIFTAARAAREAGATREEVRAILVQARPIALAIRVDLVDLHYAIWSVFTDAQKLWIVSHRPRRMPMPIAP
jgi:hypothetical protein